MFTLTHSKEKVSCMYRQPDMLSVWPFLKQEEEKEEMPELIEGTMEWIVAKVFCIDNGQGNIDKKKDFPKLAEIIIPRITASEKETFLSVYDENIGITWWGPEKVIMSNAFQRIALTSDYISSLLRENKKYPKAPK